MKEQCPKCGYDDFDYQYLPKTDKLRLTCNRCEYRKLEDPLDKVRGKVAALRAQTQEKPE